MTKNSRKKKAIISSIKKRMTELNVSQRRLGQETRLSYTHINRILSGATHNPTLDTIFRIEKALSMQLTILN